MVRSGTSRRAFGVHRSLISESSRRSFRKLSPFIRRVPAVPSGNSNHSFSASQSGSFCCLFGEFPSFVVHSGGAFGGAGEAGMFMARVSPMLRRSCPMKIQPMSTYMNPAMMERVLPV